LNLVLVQITQYSTNVKLIIVHLKGLEVLLIDKKIRFSFKL